MMNHGKIKYKSKDVEHRSPLNWKYKKGGHQHPERMQAFWQYKYDLKYTLFCRTEKKSKINMEDNSSHLVPYCGILTTRPFF